MMKQKLYVAAGVCCVLVSLCGLRAEVEAAANPAETGPGPAEEAAGRVVEVGIAQFEAGELEAARETLLGALEATGDRALPLAYLGRIALAEKEYDAAIDRLKEAVELEPADSTHRTWLGRAYIEKLQTVSFFERGVLAGRALDALKKAVELDPANVDARVFLAGYYLNAPVLAGGSVRKAREQAEAIVALDPSRGSSVLAGIHIKNEEYDEALAILESCAAERPRDLDCRYQLAMLHQQLERYESAFETFEAILEIEPDDRGALYQLGRTAAISGERVERGIECLELYLTLEEWPGHPGHDGAHWRLGMLYEHLDDRARARSEYETAIRLNPDEEMYRESLESLGGA